MRSQRKKGLVAAVVALGAVGLAACSGGEPDGTGSETGSDEPITLTLLSHYVNEPLQPGLQAIVDEWNAANPDIQVETRAVAFAELLQTITVQQTGGQQADIVQAYGLWGGQLKDAGVLAEVPAAIQDEIRADYLPAAVGAASVAGEIVGYPTEVQTYALYYNKDLLAAGGYDAPPATWDELVEIADAVTVQDDAGNLTVSGFGISQGWDSIAVHPWMSLMFAAGGEFVDEEGATALFDSDEGVAALQLERDLIESGTADISMDVLAAFPSNQIAMTINAGWWIGNLRTQMEGSFDSVGVAPVPGPTAGDRGSVAYGFFMGVNERSEHQEAAWEFLSWLNSDPGENGASRQGTFLHENGTIPARQVDLDVLVDDDPTMAVFVDALDYAVPEPNPPAGQEIKTELQTRIESLWVGGATAREALTAAADFANSRL